MPMLSTHAPKMNEKSERISIGKPEKGAMIIMPAGVPHSLKAVEHFKMLLIMIRGA